jgi:hypothetical protein
MAPVAVFKVVTLFKCQNAFFGFEFEICYFFTSSIISLDVLCKVLLCISSMNFLYRSSNILVIVLFNSIIVSFVYSR